MSLDIEIEMDVDPAIAIPLSDAMDDFNHHNYPEYFAAKRPWTLERLRSTYVFIAAFDGENRKAPIGIIALKFGGKFAELCRLFIDTEFRGRRVASKLLEAAQERAKKEGNVEILRLETGYRRPEGTRLYRSFGFEECEQFSAISEHPLFFAMQKRLY